MSDEDFDSHDIVQRHRWIAGCIEQNTPPTIGQWNTPEMLRDAASEIEKLRAALQEFVDRCDRGEVRSRYTYSKFKRLLTKESERT